MRCTLTGLNNRRKFSMDNPRGSVSRLFSNVICSPIHANSNVESCTHGASGWNSTPSSILGRRSSTYHGHLQSDNNVEYPILHSTSKLEHDSDDPSWSKSGLAKKASALVIQRLAKLRKLASAASLAPWITPPTCGRTSSSGCGVPFSPTSLFMHLFLLTWCEFF